MCIALATNMLSNNCVFAEEEIDADTTTTTTIDEPEEGPTEIIGAEDTIADG